CQHPHRCINQVLKLLNTLPEKWDPRSELPEDYQIKPVLTDTTDTGVTTDSWRMSEGHHCNRWVLQERWGIRDLCCSILGASRSLKRATGTASKDRDDLRIIWNKRNNS
ncbi:hypothetical protein F5879DRAFT_813625, partial [Lentinula edodes]